MLSDLIDIPSGSLISLVGAGGKTTTMYTLASELAGKGMRVVTTTTTNMYFPGQGETDTLIVSPETPTLLKMVNSAWKQHHRVTVAGRVIGAGKIGGVQAAQPVELLTKGGADIVIVEADGARHCMIKAPAEHEPVIPFRTNLAFLLMSAEAINQPLSTEVAHRPERISFILGIKQGDILTPERVASLMTSEQGAMKNIPAQAIIYLLITHFSIKKQDAVQELISLVHHSHRLAKVVCSAKPGNWFLL